MRYNKWLKVGLAAAGCALGSLANAGEVTTTTERSFLITYPDGAKETVLVRYEAILDSNVRQTGRASKPLQGHPFDDRRCEWSISARVQARPFLVSRSGALAPLTDVVVVADNVHHDGRGPTNDFQAAGFYHATCGDKRSTINRQIDTTRQVLIGAFPGHVEADSTRIATDLTKLLKPLKVGQPVKVAQL